MEGYEDLVLSGRKCAAAALWGMEALSPMEARKIEPSSASSGKKTVDD